MAFITVNVEPRDIATEPNLSEFVTTVHALFTFNKFHVVSSVKFARRALSRLHYRPLRHLMKPFDLFLI